LRWEKKRFVADADDGKGERGVLALSPQMGPGGGKRGEANALVAQVGKKRKEETLIFLSFVLSRGKKGKGGAFFTAQSASKRKGEEKTSFHPLLFMTFWKGKKKKVGILVTLPLGVIKREEDVLASNVPSK